MTVAVLPGADVLQAPVPYLERPAEGEELFNYAYEPPKGVPRSNGTPIDHTVSITDIRAARDQMPFTFEKQGFKLVDFPAGQKVTDWSDELQVRERYYPEVHALLKRVAGVTRTEIFDHTLRGVDPKQRPDGQENRDPQPVKDSLQQSPKLNTPVLRAHVDFSAKSGPRRLKDIMKDEAERLGRTPYGILQVWRPLAGPVDDSPLVLADASSVAAEDLMPVALHRPTYSGQTYAVAHNPAHKWYWAKGITTDEAYVFSCYDSRTDGRARFTPHTAFKNPATGAEAPARRSIEIRALVFWENGTVDEKDLDAY